MLPYSIAGAENRGRDREPKTRSKRLRSRLPRREMSGQTGAQDRAGHHDAADQSGGGRRRHRGTHRQLGQGGEEVRLGQGRSVRERREEDFGNHRGLRGQEDHNALRIDGLWKLFLGFCYEWDQSKSNL